MMCVCKGDPLSKKPTLYSEVVEGGGEGWSGEWGRSVPSHQKLLNPCIDALHGLLNEKRVGRVQTAVAVSKKSTSYSVVVCGPGL